MITDFPKDKKGRQKIEHLSKMQKKQVEQAFEKAFTDIHQKVLTYGQLRDDDIMSVILEEIRDIVKGIFNIK